jgi:hypothetical protein
VASTNFTDWLMMGCAGRKNFRRIATQIVRACSYSVFERDNAASMISAAVIPGAIECEAW